MRPRALLGLVAVACGPTSPPDAATDGASTVALTTAADTSPTTARPATSGSTDEPAPTTDADSTSSTGGIEPASTSTSGDTSTGTNGSIEPASTSHDTSTGADTEDTGGGSLCDGLLTVTVDGEWLLVASPEDKAALAGVECIDGNLAITPDAGDATGLESLRIITGALSAGIEEPPEPPPSALFQGLDNLERIGSLELFNAPVNSLAGLESLHTVDGGVVIFSAPLQDLHGLEGLHTIGGLRLGSCAGEQYPSSIPSLAGLENLTVITGSINIASDAMVEVALPALESLGWLKLCNAELLASVSLPSLVAAGSIELTDFAPFPQLTALDLPKLKQIDLDLSIRKTQLADLAGLAALQSIGGSLDLQDNNLLPTCTAEAFAAGLQIGGSVSILGNLPDACGG